MIGRRWIVLSVITAFFLAVSGAAPSLAAGDTLSGTVTGIDGNQVRIKDFMGDEKTIEPRNPEALADLKVGDKAVVKDGILTKSVGAAPPPKPYGPKY